MHGGGETCYAEKDLFPEEERTKQPRIRRGKGVNTPLNTKDTRMTDG